MYGFVNNVTLTNSIKIGGMPIPELLTDLFQMISILMFFFMRNSGILNYILVFIGKVVPNPQRKQVTFTYFHCKLM